MDLLKVNKIDGKKGSQKPLKWGAKEQEAFETLKNSLSAELELFQINVDKPFVMRTDASDWAIGAVLEQEVEGRLVPVAFYSRKLGVVNCIGPPERRNVMPLWHVYVSGRGGLVFNRS